MPTAVLGYSLAIAQEDRATLGSDPSAWTMPYGRGEVHWGLRPLYAASRPAVPVINDGEVKLPKIKTSKIILARNKQNELYKGKY